MRERERPLGQSETILCLSISTVAAEEYLKGPISEPSYNLNLMSTKSSSGIWIQFFFFFFFSSNPNPLLPPRFLKFQSKLKYTLNQRSVNLRIHSNEKEKLKTLPSVFIRVKPFQRLLTLFASCRAVFPFFLLFFLCFFCWWMLYSTTKTKIKLKVK